MAATSIRLMADTNNLHTADSLTAVTVTAVRLGAVGGHEVVWHINCEGEGPREQTWSLGLGQLPSCQSDEITTQVSVS